MKKIKSLFLALLAVLVFSCCQTAIGQTFKPLPKDSVNLWKQKATKIGVSLDTYIEGAEYYNRGVSSGTSTSGVGSLDTSFFYANQYANYVGSTFRRPFFKDYYNKNVFVNNSGIRLAELITDDAGGSCFASNTTSHSVFKNVDGTPFYWGFTNTELSNYVASGSDASGTATAFTSFKSSYPNARIIRVTVIAPTVLYIEYK